MSDNKTIVSGWKIFVFIFCTVVFKASILTIIYESSFCFYKLKKERERERKKENKRNRKKKKTDRLICFLIRAAVNLLRLQI